MENTPDKKTPSSIGWLLTQIEEFLANNPTVTPSSFGWRAIGDFSLVERLRKGGDIQTRKMDEIIAFLHNPNQKRKPYEPRKKRGPHKPRTNSSGNS